MNNEIQIFNYEGVAEVRTVIRDGEPWFVAKDVAEILGFDHTPTMTRTLDDDEKGVHIVHTPGGLQQMTVINEPGLYSVILKSRKPEAKRFKRWVTHEVLPTIRKTGGYVAKDVADILGIGNITKALKRLDEDEFSSTKVVDSIGRKFQVKEEERSSFKLGLVKRRLWQKI